jgi:hypothetical protein
MTTFGYFLRTGAGTSVRPTTNDFVYSDPYGQTPKAAGNYVLNNQTVIVVTGSVGEVTSTDICTGTIPGNGFKMSGGNASCDVFCIPSASNYLVQATSYVASGHSYSEIVAGDVMSDSAGTATFLASGYYAFAPANTETNPSSGTPGEFRLVLIAQASSPTRSYVDSVLLCASGGTCVNP